MRTELLNVNPSLAREWLRRNTNNRPMRQSHVATLRQSFERGEYVPTHQGIAFDAEGVLLDGQHRLAAIALMEDSHVFPMLVTFGLNRDAAFDVIDATQAKRTTSDVLKIDRDVGEIASFLAAVYKGTSAGITPTYTRPFVDFCLADTLELVAYCGKRTRVWSSASVRAAAVLWMKFGHSEYAKNAYRALVTSEFDDMPKIVQALYRSQVIGRVSTRSRLDMLLRCLKAFDPELAQLSRIQINDQNYGVTELRKKLHKMVRVDGSAA